MNTKKENILYYGDNLEILRDYIKDESVIMPKKQTVSCIACSLSIGILYRRIT